jgi:hypothetical protein
VPSRRKVGFLPSERKISKLAVIIGSKIQNKQHRKALFPEWRTAVAAGDPNCIVVVGSRMKKVLFETGMSNFSKLPR